MPTIVLRPDGDISVGNFNPSSVHGNLSDQNDVTNVFNTTTNQTFSVTLDDPETLESNTIFNSFILSVRAFKSGKAADTSFDGVVRNNDSGTVYGNFSFSTTSSSVVELNSASTNFPSGTTLSDIENTFVQITTTNNRQAIFTEIFLTIDYSEGTPPTHMNLSSGKITLSSGKITI